MFVEFQDDIDGHLIVPTAGKGDDAGLGELETGAVVDHRQQFVGLDIIRERGEEPAFSLEDRLRVSSRYKFSGDDADLGGVVWLDALAQDAFDEMFLIGTGGTYDDTDGADRPGLGEIF